MTGNPSRDDGKLAGLRKDAAPLPKRFYKSAAVTPAEDGHAIALDGRLVKTPRKTLIVVPTEALAHVLAQEWNAQTDVIDPATMTMTRLVNTALDGVTGREHEVRDDIVKFAGSDLLCYRAEHPDTLIQLQCDSWDPVLDWARSTFGIALRVCDGIMPVAQDKASLLRVSQSIEKETAAHLTALHTMTTLTGSAILALAVRHRHLDAEAAWCTAHIDEDWQIEQWGYDEEAAARRAHRWSEMEAAATLLRLLG
jgi:chaperone required for assembly of F1-ATPase